MESILNPNPEIVVALNIGTNKVIAMVGKKNILGKMEILGYGKASCDGVMRGVVTNIEKHQKQFAMRWIWLKRNPNKKFNLFLLELPVTI